MNNDRRKAIQDLVNTLNDAKAQMEDIQSEEQDYLDNMMESLRNSDKGEAAEAAVGSLEDAADNIGATIENLEEASA